MTAEVEQELRLVKMHLARLKEANRLKAEATVKLQRELDRAALIEGRLIPKCCCDICLTGLLEMTGTQCTSQH